MNKKERDSLDEKERELLCRNHFDVKFFEVTEDWIVEQIQTMEGKLKYLGEEVHNFEGETLKSIICGYTYFLRSIYALRERCYLLEEEADKMEGKINKLYKTQNMILNYLNLKAEGKIK